MTVYVLNVSTMICALMLALFGPLIGCLRQTPNKLTPQTFFLDLLRGATLAPLLVLAFAPYVDGMWEVVAEANVVLVSLACLAGIATVLQDWWRSM